MFDLIDLDHLTDPEQVKEGLRLLLNLLEELKQDNVALRKELQRLRDELNRLKGEQAKPDIKANKSKDESDHSSEKERKTHKKARNSSKKKDKIKIDRTEVVRLDKSALPEDAVFKGYQEVVVQDIKLTTDNVLFRKEKYYSPSQGKSYLASLPAGYVGAYGPGVKALSIIFYYVGNMTQPKILDLMGNIGLLLSSAQLSRWLSSDQADFEAERDGLFRAGLASSPWQQIDETAMRVSGENRHTHIVCNPLYTYYKTTQKKDRLAVIEVLRGSDERLFCLNDEAMLYLEGVGLSRIKRAVLSDWVSDEPLSESEFSALVSQVPLGAQQRKWVFDAGAIAAYHAQQDITVVHSLLCDDAPQFKGITEQLSLCWVHDGRHYKKLVPYVSYHAKLVDDFLKQYWHYYGQLLGYKAAPMESERGRLSEEFDRLFSHQTGYDALDDRIAKTRAKKAFLLLVLAHPELPLHNNDAELGARQRVRKRKVSVTTRSESGTVAWDTYMSLAATTKKLGISFYRYVFDRIMGRNQVPSLAEIITERADQMKLGASWDIQTS